MIFPILIIAGIYLVVKKGKTATAVKGATPNKATPTNVNSAARQTTNQAQAQSTSSQLETAAGGIAISYLAKSLSSWVSGLSDSGGISSSPDPAEPETEPEIDETDLTVAENEMGAESYEASSDSLDVPLDENVDEMEA